MRTAHLNSVLVLTCALVCPASAEAGWCTRKLLQYSFAVQEKLQGSEPRDAVLFLDEISSITVRLDLEPNWKDFTNSARLFESGLFGLRSSFDPELKQFRRMTFTQRQNHLAEVAAELDSSLFALSDSDAIGFHYNKSGGTAAEFVWRGGLYVTHGNLSERRALTFRGGLRGNTSTRPVIMGPPTVFYFHSSDMPFSKFLVSSIYRSTPNDVAIFDIQKVQSTGGVVPVRGYYGRAFSYPGRRVGEIGVSVDSFVIPPVRLLTAQHWREVFLNHLHLSYEEMELAALRHFSNHLDYLLSKRVASD
jgi:hypothetical protein